MLSWGVVLHSWVSTSESFIALLFSTNELSRRELKLVWRCLENLVQIHLRHLKRPFDHSDQIIIFKGFVNLRTDPTTPLLINRHVKLNFVFIICSKRFISILTFIRAQRWGYSSGSFERGHFCCHFLSFY